MIIVFNQLVLKYIGILLIINDYTLVIVQYN